MMHSITIIASLLIGLAVGLLLGLPWRETPPITLARAVLTTKATWRERRNLKRNRADLRTMRERSC